MNLINKLISNSKLHKHTLELLNQAMEENEKLQENARRDFKDIQELKNQIVMLEKFISCYAEKFKKVKKIRTLVNKLDKKNEYVKEIKTLIKEVLS